MSVQVTLVGNLTRDPEIKIFESGKQVGRSSVAVNERKRDAAGNWVDGDSAFFELVVFNGQIENFVNSCKKGDRVVVTGRLRPRQWETEDGKKGMANEILVDEVAPSLRFATAQVTKNPKSNGGTGRDMPVDEGDYLS